MIEVRRLRHCTAAAEELNFHRAAERVHIDPAPLSCAIRHLEEQRGVSLFVRAPRRLFLRPVGARLLNEVPKVFVRAKRVQRVVRVTRTYYGPPLRIGVADGIAQPIGPVLHSLAEAGAEVTPGADREARRACRGAQARSASRAPSAGMTSWAGSRVSAV
jgi:DNA-binding transcriptional LysR family regulator